MRALLALLLVALACGPRTGEKPGVPAGTPVVIISIDTLRADRLPAYGYEGVETPALDALRRDGILFERAYTPTPLTFPAHSSLLTGLLPGVHGVRDNVGYKLDPGLPFLPRLLKGKGYATGGAVSAYVLQGKSGLDDGFDFYEDSIELRAHAGLGGMQRPGGETLMLSREWLGSVRGRPFFFFFHIYEPHAPWEAPAEFRSRYADPYDAEVAAADAVLGELFAELKRLEIYDKATIVVLSDHGEGLGDHGEEQHGLFLYREVLQVPLLVKLPGGRRGGERVAAPAQLADVAPTLLSLAGVEVPESLPGVSLLDLGEKSPARQLYSETFYPRIHFGWSDLASLVADRFHYIEAPEPELYDLAADPGETRNVLAGERRAYSELRQAMKAYDRRLSAPAAVDAETAAKLAALGYAGGSMAEREGPLPDPKSQRHVIAGLEKAMAASQGGRHEEAAALFERLLAENRDMQDVWAFYAMSLQKIGRHDDSAKAYEEALKLSGGSPQLALAAATKFLELGRYDDAREHAEIARQQYPEEVYDLLSQIALRQGDTAGAMAVMQQAIDEGKASEPLRRQMALSLSESGRPAEAAALLQPLAGTGEPPTLNALAIALSDSGKHAEALAVLQRVLRQDPQNAHAYQTLGMVELRQQRPAEARDHLRKALAIKDDLPIAWNTLGVALYQTEGPAAAVAAWQRAVALDPRLYDALYNLGLVAAQHGMRNEARQALRQFVATAPPQRFAADIRKAQGILREIGG